MKGRWKMNFKESSIMYNLVFIIFITVILISEYSNKGEIIVIGIILFAWLHLLFFYKLKANTGLYKFIIWTAFCFLIMHTMLDKLILKSVIQNDLVKSGIFWLIAFCLVGLQLKIGKGQKISGDKKDIDYNLFPERKADLETIERYLNRFDVLGINGDWGSGKSFLVKEMKSSDKFKEYEFVLISSMVCNIDDVQEIIVAELGKVLNRNGIFSLNTLEIKRLLSKNKFVGGYFDGIIFYNDSFSNTMSGFKADFKKLDKKVVLVIDDIDRINDINTIKKIFSITELLSDSNIKIIFNFSQKNLRMISSEFNRKYLEKYVPYIINLSRIDFFQIINYLLSYEKEFKNITINKDDFLFLRKPIQVKNYFKQILMDKPIYWGIDGITVRHVRTFLLEVNELVKNNREDELYKNVVIIFCIMKHFDEYEYNKLNGYNSVVEALTFTYKGQSYSLYDLTNGFDIIAGKQDNYNLGIEMAQHLFNDRSNRNVLAYLHLMGCTKYINEKYGSYKDVLLETEKELITKNKVERINRIVWKLLYSGKSSLTDMEKAVSKFKEDVLGVNEELRGNAYDKYLRDYAKGGKYYNEDNRTVFLIGVEAFTTLFKCMKIVENSTEEWLDFLKFYFGNINNKDIKFEVISNLMYCPIEDKRILMYVTEQFCKLEVAGDLSSEKIYKDFVRKYMMAFNLFKMIEVKKYIDDLYNKNIQDIEKLLSKTLGYLAWTSNKEMQLMIKLAGDFIGKNLEIIKSGNILDIDENRIKADVKIVDSQADEAKRLESFPGTIEDKIREAEKSFIDNKIDFIVYKNLSFVKENFYKNYN